MLECLSMFELFPLVWAMHDSCECDHVLKVFMSLLLFRHVQTLHILWEWPWPVCFTCSECKSMISGPRRPDQATCVWRGSKLQSWLAWRPWTVLAPFNAREKLCWVYSQMQYFGRGVYVIYVYCDWFCVCMFYLILCPHGAFWIKCCRAFILDLWWKMLWQLGRMQNLVNL